jgi:hypothetical protein
MIPSVELSSAPDGSGGELDLGLNGGYEESGDGFFGETVRLSDFERTFVWSADSFVNSLRKCNDVSGFKLACTELLHGRDHPVLSNSPSCL